jgi:hypothetical protein
MALIADPQLDERSRNSDSINGKSGRFPASQWPIAVLSTRHRLQIRDLGTHLGEMPAGEVVRRLAGADRIVREPQQRPCLIETETQRARSE